MSDAEKTVFISYRRDVSSYIARAIFLDLRSNGYDVFMDVESIDSGPFDTLILNQIEARGHFVIILTPGTVERCIEPNDWLYHEIDYAIEKQRNIVPVLVNGFTFTGTEHFLLRKLSELPRYNGLALYHDYFDAAMDKLRNRFLKQPVYGKVIPELAQDKPIVEQKIEAVARQPTPTEAQLSAEDHFNQGYVKGNAEDFDGAIAAYDEAIRLNPQLALAYNNRGSMRMHKGDIDGAISDYDTAIHMIPRYADAYNNRGIAYYRKGEIAQAIANYDAALRLKPQYIEAYNNRGVARRKQGDIAGAIADYDEVIRLNPQYGLVYSNKGEAHFAVQQYDLALAAFRKSNELLPGDSITLAGLAITQHVLGQTAEATRLWKLLLTQDEHYRDADWVGKELNWAAPLMEEVRKLIVKI